MGETARTKRGPEIGTDRRGRDRRIYERFDLNAAFGSLIYRGNRIRCQVLDISLGGCRVRSQSPFTAGSLAHVELILPICGIVLRIWGITQWTTEDHEIGIRFIHPTFGSKNQLAGLLTFLVDHSAEDVVKSAMAEVVTAPATTPILVLEKRDNVPQKPKSPDLPRLDTKSEGRSTALSSAAAPARETPAKIKSGKEYEWPAVIRFTKDGLHVAGVIVDLNLGGCSVRTAEPYISGIYHHVEVDFHMRGLPFRIAGATEAVRDKHTVDIRFLQLSSRKRQELAQLIFELCEPDKAK